jgi:hypothetical protein
MEIKATFTWELPNKQWDDGLIYCPRKFGGCGRWHEFSVEDEDFDYQISFNTYYETTYRQGFCDKFEEWLEKDAKEEWEIWIKDKYLAIVGEEAINEAKEAQKRLVSEGVSVRETQWEQEFGAIRPVGFYRKRQEIFVCGNCSEEMLGSMRNGRAKNRNNPAFWGLEAKEKVLCGECLGKRKGEMPTIRRMKFNQYWKIGMFGKEKEKI